MTYERLLQAYSDTHGGPPQGPAGGDDFNNWVIATTGTGDWDAIPDDFNFNAPTIGTAPTSTGTPSVTAPTPTGTPSTPASGLDLGALVPSATAAAPRLPPITPVGAPPGAQGFSQNQVGGQTGDFTSVGATNQTQNGTQSQTGTESSTGSQSQTGTQTQTTSVNDPLDLTSLLRTQLPGTADRDTANQEWLSNFRDTGGTGFNSQVDEAVRLSLTGPQTTGSGESARARMAGSAGANVARNNAGQRLQAADQLSRPTGLASTVGAVAPLLGSSTTGSSAANTTTASDLAKNLNTVDFQKLVGNEASAGTAGGQSVSQGSGVAPAGQQVKSGGCVVCTAYVSRGEMKPGAVRRACEFKQRMWHRYGTSLDGYLLYGPVLARMILSSDLFAVLFRPVARAVLYEEVRLSAPTRLRKKWNAYITHGVFDLLSWPVGLFSKLVGLNTGVRDEKIKDLLKKQNLNFSI